MALCWVQVIRFLTFVTMWSPQHLTGKDWECLMGWTYQFHRTEARTQSCGQIHRSLGMGVCSWLDSTPIHRRSLCVIFGLLLLQHMCGKAWASECQVTWQTPQGVSPTGSETVVWGNHYVLKDHWTKPRHRTAYSTWLQLYSVLLKIRKGTWQLIDYIVC